MVTKALMAMMIGFIFSVLLAIILIPILKKLHAGQNISVYLRNTHSSKQGTPTMGGLIFVIPTLFVVMLLIYLDKIHFSYTLLIILFTFVSYTLIGFIDDYLIVKKHDNKGLSVATKLLLQTVVAIIFFYLFMKGGNEPLLWIHSLHFKLDIGFFYGLFILFVLLLLELFLLHLVGLAVMKILRLWRLCWWVLYLVFWYLMLIQRKYLWGILVHLL